MSLLDRLSKLREIVLPKPNLTLQKRYIIALAGALYIIAKCYVQSTPTLIDDQILATAHDAVLVLAADGGSDSVDYDELDGSVDSHAKS